MGLSVAARTEPAPTPMTAGRQARPPAPMLRCPRSVDGHAVLAAFAVRNQLPVPNSDLIRRRSTLRRFDERVTSSQNVGQLGEPRRSANLDLAWRLSLVAIDAGACGAHRSAGDAIKAVAGLSQVLSQGGGEVPLPLLIVRARVVVLCASRQVPIRIPVVEIEHLAPRLGAVPDERAVCNPTG